MENTLRELNYNLAQAYMDADRNGDAEPLLEDLYVKYPLEFRFAIKLAMCYRALDRTEKLAPLVEELHTRRRSQADAARKRLQEFATVARQRRQERDGRREQVSTSAEAGTDGTIANATRQQDEAREPLFNEAEQAAIRELRALAKVNLAAIDFLAGYIHVADGNPEKALEHLREAEKADVARPGLQLQIGEAYLKLKRWKDAERSFRRAGEIDPVNAHVHMGLCRSYLHRRQNRGRPPPRVRPWDSNITIPWRTIAWASRCIAWGKSIAPCKHWRSRSRKTQTSRRHTSSWQRCTTGGGAISTKPRNTENWLRRFAPRTAVRRDRRGASTSPPLALDIEATLPKVPDVEPDEPRQQPTVGHHVPRLGEAAMPGSVLPQLASGDEFVTVVTGLPRSGTSMMMQMLVASGLDPLTDEQRQRDEDNPARVFRAGGGDPIARQSELGGGRSREGHQGGGPVDSLFAAGVFVPSYFHAARRGRGTAIPAEDARAARQAGGQLGGRPHETRVPAPARADPSAVAPAPHSHAPRFLLPARWRNLPRQRRKWPSF